MDQMNLPNIEIWSWAFKKYPSKCWNICQILKSIDFWLWNFSFATKIYWFCTRMPKSLIAWVLKLAFSWVWVFFSYLFPNVQFWSLTYQTCYLLEIFMTWKQLEKAIRITTFGQSLHLTQSSIVCSLLEPGCCSCSHIGWPEYQTKHRKGNKYINNLTLLPVFYLNIPISWCCGSYPIRRWTY